MKKTEEGSQITPDLDGMMTEGRAIFDGSLPPDIEAGAALVVRPGLPGPGKEEEEAGGAPLAAPKNAGGEKPGENVPGAETETDPNKTKEDKLPDAELRFKSHEEAEKGYRHLQGEKTKAEQRAAAAEEELERIKKAEQLKEKAAQKKTEMVKNAAARRKQALDEIDALDPEAADYRDKAADILARADLDVWEHLRADGTTRQPTEAEKKAVDKMPAGDGDDKGAEELVTTIQERIAKEGLDKEDELFWMYAGQAPERDGQGKPLDLEGQLAWAITKTKEYHNKFQKAAKSETEKEAVEKSRKKQGEELPLGTGARIVTGGPGADKAGEDKPVSLADAVEAAMEQRRI